MPNRTSLEKTKSLIFVFLLVKILTSWRCTYSLIKDISFLVNKSLKRLEQKFSEKNYINDFSNIFEVKMQPSLRIVSMPLASNTGASPSDSYL